MATAFEWIKLILEYLKGNKVVLLLATSFLASVSGNIYQATKPVAKMSTPKVVGQSCECIRPHIKEYH